MTTMRPRHHPASLTGWIPNISDIVPGQPRFDTLITTVKDLQQELSTGDLTSVDIVKEYYNSILSYNGYLNAVYELAPGALEQAEKLDKMREQGQILGHLHGIPVLLKDNIATSPDLKMGTRASAVALVGSVPKTNASIVDKLTKAGAIILGKTTMSEYAYVKGEGIRCGWSTLAGQCNNPYVKGGDDPTDGLGGHSSTGGSSSGSAVSVAAGLAPISIGTETEGSLVEPAPRAALYTLKPTLGIVPGDGIIPISHRLDTAGPMAKSVHDLASLLTVIVDESKTNILEGGYASALSGAEAWKEFTIGTLSPDDCLPSDEFIKPVDEATEEIIPKRRQTLAAYGKIQELAKGYHENVGLRSDKDFDFEGQDALFSLMMADLENDMNNYLSGLEKSDVKSLKEIVEWNLQHANEALPPEYPSQSILEKAVAEKFSAERVEKIVNHIRTVGSSFDETIKNYGLDFIIAPGDSGLSVFSAALGIPIATLPIACLQYNGRPTSLQVAAPRHQEAKLIKLMSAFEATFPPRKPPTEFLDHRARLEDLC
uniref:Putative amidase n=1 Tax=Talaromyces marneffei PM1 TaxID=1077442 RepID=A0A093UVR3_TALMA